MTKRPTPAPASKDDRTEVTEVHEADVTAVAETETPVSGIHVEEAKEAEAASAQSTAFQLPAVPEAEVPVSGVAADGSSPPPDPDLLPAADYALKITGPRKGRRRAGYAFGAEPVVLPFKELSEEQAEALRSDPLLMIEIVAAS